MTSARPGTAADVGPAPRVKPVLDARFRPAVLAIRQMEAEGSRSRKAASVWVALEQPGGSVSHHAIWVLPQGHPASLRSYRTCERLLKFLLWARGASRIYVDAPADLVEALRHRYAREPAGIFDAQMMGPEIYGRAFEVVATRREAFPAPGMASTRLGGHLQGCRIGFDLGASGPGNFGLRALPLSWRRRWIVSRKSRCLPSRVADHDGDGGPPQPPLDALPRRRLWSSP